MSTFSKLRVGPKPYVAGVPKLVYISPAFDATVAAPGGIQMPPNILVTGVGTLVGTLDQAADTIDVGTAADGEEVISELVAGANTEITAVPLIALVDDKIYPSKGATATGTAGGTAQLVIEYIIADSRNGANK